MWRTLRAAVTAIDDREPIVARIERRDGVMIDMTTMPLPDGATLVTFQDVSDTVNVERALIERNEALVAADGIKIDFVHHVSYELRSPLTNIIGFAQFPRRSRPSARSPTSSANISATSPPRPMRCWRLINNILDLATIDAGAMSLNLSDVDIRASMDAAAEGVLDRLVKDNIKLDIRAAPRHRQLPGRRAAAAANSVQSAVQRGRLFAGRRNRHAGRRTAAGRGGVHGHRPRPRHSARRQGQGVRLVRDQLDGLRSHRGTGLGLSLVRSFVELHGGTVTIDSTLGQGTTVTCVFPIAHQAERTAA